MNPSGPYMRLRAANPSLPRSSRIPTSARAFSATLCSRNGISLSQSKTRPAVVASRSPGVCRNFRVSSAVSFSTSSRRYEASDWDENPNLSISAFSELPSKDFGVNQHMVINQEFKEALRQILWQFRAPIRYAFAYGSGVFPQPGSAPAAEKCHPSAPAAITKMQQGNGKMIDFIFGVSYSQHWHSLNLHQHRNHYSGLGSMGSYVVSQVQDQLGAGV